MGISFAVGVTVTGIVAARLLLPIAETGVTLGSVMANAYFAATIDTLYSGDSAARKTVLAQLKHSLDTESGQSLDKEAVAWMLPAIEQCQTDPDAEVVALANELAELIDGRTEQAQ